MTMTDADQLARSFLPRIEGIARRVVGKRSHEFDEAYSAGLVGLAEAIRDWRPEIGSFERFAALVVRLRIARYLRELKPRGRHGGRKLELLSTELAAPFSVLFGDDSPSVPDPAPPVGWCVDYEDWIEGLARKLPAPHARAFLARQLHADAEDHVGCCRRLGMDVNRSKYLYRHSLAMLRENLS